MSPSSSPYIKPGFVLSRVLNPVISLTGMTPTLAVRGRRTGEWRTVPVNILEVDGRRYLVAPRGDTQWARNLRAAGGGEIRRRGQVEPFQAVEIPPEQRELLIQAYLERFGSQVRSQFAALPDPKDHPVFEILSPN
jgi:deazaflavin-dependent oxidoreductase (nitroreductase family)